MTKSWAVEDDDTMVGQQAFRDPAGVPVIAGDNVAVDQHDRVAHASVGVMEPDPIDHQKGARRRMRRVSAAREAIIGDAKRTDSAAAPPAAIQTAGTGL